MKQTMIKQGSMLLNQYVAPTESDTGERDGAILSLISTMSSSCLVLPTEEPSRQLNLSLMLATPILIFRPQSKLVSNNDRLVFHLGDIHVENSETHPKNYEIKINRLNFFTVDLEHEFRHNQGANLTRMYKNPHLPWPILDHISIHLDLKLTDTATAIDSKLVSSVQMFLGKHQITLLQNIISSLTYNEYDEIQASASTLPEDEPLLLLDQEEMELPLVEKSPANIIQDLLHTLPTARTDPRFPS